MRAPTRIHGPTRFDAISANAIHEVVQMHDNADVVRHHSDKIPDQRAPIGLREIKNSVLFTHARHHNIRPIEERTKTLSGGAALADTSTVDGLSAGTLKLASSETLGMLTGSPALNLQSNTLTVNSISSVQCS
jgi:hypothetical protein